MATSTGDRFTRAIGAAIGVCLIAALIVAARPAGGHGGVLPARLRFSAGQDGALAVVPAAPRTLLASGPMRPGSEVHGSLMVRNQTGSALLVRLQANPSSTGLDGIAHVRLAAGGSLLADGTLQELRRGSVGAVRLAPGAATRVRVSVSIPADTETGYEGQDVSVLLVPEEEPAP